MRWAETAARLVITVGGLATIGAVVLIVVFLIWVAAPLFRGAELSPQGALDRAAVPAQGAIAVGTDSLGLSGWSLSSRGRLDVFTLPEGKPLDRRALFSGGAAPTSWSWTPGGELVACGFADGSVRVGRFAFRSSFLEGADIPAALRGARPGRAAPWRGGVAQVTPEGQVRLETLAPVTFDDVGRAGDSAVVLLDLSVTPSGRAYGVLTGAGELGIYLERVVENWMTGEKVRRLERIALPYAPDRRRGRPAFLVLSGVGRTLFLIWRDGRMVRYDAHDQPRVAEIVDLLREPGAQVTRVASLTGKATLLVGDSTGRVRAWFATRSPGAGTVDGVEMVAAHTLEGAPAAVTALVPAPRSRLCAVGYGNGEVRLFHVTSARELGRVVAGGEAVDALCLGPREELLVALTAKGGRTWKLDVGHPAASPGSLFGKVWYEGYPEPAHVWQSSAGTDDFEQKLGLVPLVFGTLKATLYSMLIAVPIAFFAALFTSEFLRPALRAPVKSTIEMMASLPSVVLGFLAALVIAPFVQAVLPATLAVLFLLPVTLLLGARLWQLLPWSVALRLAGLPRLLAIAAALPAAVAAGALCGKPLERALFRGDLKAWLDAAERARSGAPVAAALLDPGGGWLVLLLPATALLTLSLAGRFVAPRLAKISVGWSRAACARADLAKLLLGLGAALLAAYAASEALTALGADPRGGLVGTYAQRNALIVGFVMGFAIIPILYTLAEDALASVPAALREASLGAGATPWQTALRIVVPTAMSGLFGALMVGLGRAVGETMIVLMAAGNTPILDWNIFNGFRTLSANIAVELPEAVKDSTHYRTLFLAALVLFAMTFVINTAAELVRRRARRRFQEL